MQVLKHFRFTLYSLIVVLVVILDSQHGWHLYWTPSIPMIGMIGALIMVREPKKSRHNLKFFWAYATIIGFITALVILYATPTLLVMRNNFVVLLITGFVALLDIRFFSTNS